MQEAASVVLVHYEIHKCRTSNTSKPTVTAIETALKAQIQTWSSSCEGKYISLAQTTLLPMKPNAPITARSWMKKLMGEVKQKFLRCQKHLFYFRIYNLHNFWIGGEEVLVPPESITSFLENSCDVQLTALIVSRINQCTITLSRVTVSTYRISISKITLENNDRQLPYKPKN